MRNEVEFRIERSQPPDSYIRLIGHAYVGTKMAVATVAFPSDASQDEIEGGKRSLLRQFNHFLREGN